MIGVKILRLIVLIFILINLALHRDSKLEERKQTKYFTIHKSAEAHRADIEKAHRYWTKETGIKFIEKYRPFNTVKIFTSKRELASSESTVGVYMINKYIIIYDQSDFYAIVLHEIGHSIGLEHNEDVNDIMYPTTESLAEITETSLQELKEIQQKKNYILFY